MPRLFCEIPLPENVQHELSLWQHRHIFPGVRMTQRETLHVTVAFFGSVADEHVAALGAALQAVATTHHVFTLTLEQIIPFPNLHPTMWWASCIPSEEFTMLTEDIQNAAAAFAPNMAQREQLPHITLARYMTIPPALRQDDGIAPQKIPVTHCDLMESHLTDQGSRFTLRTRLPLLQQ